MGAYADAGVNSRLINPFKHIMMQVAARTRRLPNRHNVIVNEDGTYDYIGRALHTNAKPVLEGAGNKPWLSQWMRENSQLSLPFYQWVAMDTVRMATNDLIVQGAMPATLNDEIAAASSEWFSDIDRAAEIGNGFFEACATAGAALVGGESPATKYLHRSDCPGDGACSMSVSVTGIIAPRDRRPRPELLQPGDRMIGVRSSGPHANGFSLIIRDGLELEGKFLMPMPSGMTFGEAALAPTMCYVKLVKALLESDIEIHGIQPITGDGLTKMALLRKDLGYHFECWPEPQEVFLFMREHFQLSLDDCLKTFNWGIGLCFVVPREDVDASMETVKRAGYEGYELGGVIADNRSVYFEPMNLHLPPAGE